MEAVDEDAVTGELLLIITGVLLLVVVGVPVGDEGEVEEVLVPEDVAETELVVPDDVADPEVEVAVAEVVLLLLLLLLEVVVVDPAPPFTIVNSPDSGNVPVPPFRGSKTTW